MSTKRLKQATATTTTTTTTNDGHASGAAGSLIPFISGALYELYQRIRAYDYSEYEKQVRADIEAQREGENEGDIVVPEYVPRLDDVPPPTEVNLVTYFRLVSGNYIAGPVQFVDYGNVDTVSSDISAAVVCKMLRWHILGSDTRRHNSWIKDYIPASIADVTIDDTPSFLPLFGIVVRDTPAEARCDKDVEAISLTLMAMEALREGRYDATQTFTPSPAVLSGHLSFMKQVRDNAGGIRNSSAVTDKQALAAYMLSGTRMVYKEEVSPVFYNLALARVSFAMLKDMRARELYATKTAYVSRFKPPVDMDILPDVFDEFYAIVSGSASTIAPMDSTMTCLDMLVDKALPLSGNRRYIGDPVRFRSWVQYYQDSVVTDTVARSRLWSGLQHLLDVGIGDWVIADSLRGRLAVPVDEDVRCMILVSVFESIAGAAFVPSEPLSKRSRIGEARQAAGYEEQVTEEEESDVSPGTRRRPKASQPKSTLIETAMSRGRVKSTGQAAGYEEQVTEEEESDVSPGTRRRPKASQPARTLTGTAMSRGRANSISRVAWSPFSSPSSSPVVPRVLGNSGTAPAQPGSSSVLSGPLPDLRRARLASSPPYAGSNPNPGLLLVEGGPLAGLKTADPDPDATAVVNARRPLYEVEESEEPVEQLNVRLPDGRPGPWDGPPEIPKRSGFLVDFLSRFYRKDSNAAEADSKVAQRDENSMIEIEQQQELQSDANEREGMGRWNKDAWTALTGLEDAPDAGGAVKNDYKGVELLMKYARLARTPRRVDPVKAE